MVHAVMAWGIEDELDESWESPNGFSVLKKLIDEADGHEHDDHQGVKPNERQPHPPEIFVKQFSPTLPQGDREIVLLARVMVDVCGPKEPDLVATAVMEIKCEILRKKEDDGRPPDVWNWEKAMLIEPHHGKKCKRLGTQVDDGTPHTHAQARPGIAGHVGRQAFPSPHQHFDPNRDQKKWDRKADHRVNI
jgi:hypothetical protein